MCFDTKAWRRMTRGKLKGPAGEHAPGMAHAFPTPSLASTGTIHGVALPQSHPPPPPSSPSPHSPPPPPPPTPAPLPTAPIPCRAPSPPWPLVLPTHPLPRPPPGPSPSLAPPQPLFLVAQELLRLHMRSSALLHPSALARGIDPYAALACLFFWAAKLAYGLDGRAQPLLPHLPPPPGGAGGWPAWAQAHVRHRLPVTTLPLSEEEVGVLCLKGEGRESREGSHGARQASTNS